MYEVGIEIIDSIKVIMVIANMKIAFVYLFKILEFTGDLIYL